MILGSVTPDIGCGIRKLFQGGTQTMVCFQASIFKLHNSSKAPNGKSGKNKRENKFYTIFSPYASTVCNDMNLNGAEG